jgi:YidC/Oxa1 family membrane protein insertase
MLAFAPLNAATNAASVMVAHLATLLAPVGGTAAAIIVFTMLVRLLLHPLTRAAVRGEKVRLRLAPQAAQLRRKHADNPVRAAEKLTELYRAEGVSPLAGMMPLLAQAPFFLVMYQIFVHTSIGGHTNALLAQQLFGVGLGTRFATGVASLGPHLWVFGVLFGVLAALALVASRRVSTVMAAGESTPSGWLARLSRLLPFTIVVTAAFVPLAAGLYLLTSTAWTAAENALLRRGLPDPLPARQST